MKNNGADYPNVFDRAFNDLHNEIFNMHTSCNYSFMNMVRSNRKYKDSVYYSYTMLLCGRILDWLDASCEELKKDAMGGE